MDVICAKKERIPAVNLHTQRLAAYGLDQNWPMAYVCADQEQRTVFKILNGCKKKPSISLSLTQILLFMTE